MKKLIGFIAFWIAVGMLLMLLFYQQIYRADYLCFVVTDWL